MAEFVDVSDQMLTDEMQRLKLEAAIREVAWIRMIPASYRETRELSLPSQEIPRS